MPRRPMSAPMWIVLVMCLSPGPLCRDVTVGQTASLQTCLLDALPAAAEWADAHPGYELDTIRCQDEEPEEGQEL